jgi:hypothetical protein
LAVLHTAEQTRATPCLIHRLRHAADVGDGDDPLGGSRAQRHVAEVERKAELRDPPMRKAFAFERSAQAPGEQDVVKSD